MLITIIKNVQVFDLMQQWWGWYELCGGFARVLPLLLSAQDFSLLLSLLQASRKFFIWPQLYMGTNAEI